MLELKNICYRVSTPEGELDILKNVSITIPDHKLVVFTGPNGGGKTTLAKVIMGLVQPTSGQILLDGEDITVTPELPIEPVTPGEPLVFDTAVAATNAAAKAVLTPSAEVAAALGEPLADIDEIGLSANLIEKWVVRDTATDAELVVYANKKKNKKKGKLIRCGTMEDVKGDTSLESVFLELEG